MKSHEPIRREKPASYGRWWLEGETIDLAWYEQIFDDRRLTHNAFLAWLSDLETMSGDRIESVLEIGCGRGVVYPRVFADRRYVGFDISEKEIAWCNEHLATDRHAFVAGDFIEWESSERFDLVFSHAVIDHVYDMDAFLRQMVRASNGWVYCAAYRGWNPRLDHHVYNWNEQDAVFYNDLSPRAALRTLDEMGAYDSRVYPLTPDNQLDCEAVITAAIRPGLHQPPMPAGVLRFLARLLERTYELEAQNRELSHQVEKVTGKVDLILYDVRRLKELIKRVPFYRQLQRWLEL